MPNLDEFLNKPKVEKVLKAELENIGGTKPCSKCEKDATEVYWDPTTLTMSWTCPDGHENSYRIN